MPAFAMPLLSEEVESWKAWTHDLTNGRKAEFDDFNHRMGLTSHRVWLMQSPQGPMAVVLHDGPGADTILEKLASSDHPFDTWFRERVSRFHGVDFSHGMPGLAPESVMDWISK